MSEANRHFLAEYVITVPPLMRMEPNTLITAPTTHVTIPQAIARQPPSVHMIGLKHLPGPDSLKTLVSLRLAT